MHKKFKEKNICRERERRDFLSTADKYVAPIGYVAYTCLQKNTLFRTVEDEQELNSFAGG